MSIKGVVVANRLTGADLQGDLLFSGSGYPKVGVRMQGGDSYAGTASQKKGLSISMDAFVAGQTLRGYDNINLHNGFNDPTLMREVISYEILRKYMPAPGQSPAGLHPSRGALPWPRPP